MDTIEYKDFTINIHQDDGPMNPRDWDNLGTMVCFHNRYDLGDDSNIDIDGLKEIVARKDVIALPLYLYDHSGIWMRTNRSYPFNCPWDSGQVGYIYVDYTTIRKEYSCKYVTKSIINKVVNCLVNEVEAYSQYISGDVWGYSIEDPEGEHVDSCYGYYDTSDMIKECESIIDDNILERNMEKIDMMIQEVGML